MYMQWSFFFFRLLLISPPLGLLEMFRVLIVNTRHLNKIYDEHAPNREKKQEKKNYYYDRDFTVSTLEHCILHFVTGHRQKKMKKEQKNITKTAVYECEKFIKFKVIFNCESDYEGACACTTIHNMVSFMEKKTENIFTMENIQRFIQIYVIYGWRLKMVFFVALNAIRSHQMNIYIRRFYFSYFNFTFFSLTQFK